MLLLNLCESGFLFLHRAFVIVDGDVLGIVMGVVGAVNAGIFG